MRPVRIACDDYLSEPVRGRTHGATIRPAHSKPPSRSPETWSAGPVSQEFAILQLQRVIGNAAVQKLVHAASVVQRQPYPPSPITGLNVTIPQIRGPSTPKAMSDRIPPGVDIPLRIHVAGWYPLLDPVAVVVDGYGGANGEALLNGAEQAEFKATENAKLKGTKQTAPGSAGHLRLIAYVGMFQVGSSNTFSVSAIPRKMSFTLDHLLTGSNRGFVVKDTVKSDSGHTADLDEIEISECVDDIRDEFPGLPKTHSG